MTPRIYYKRIKNQNIDAVHFYEHLVMCQLLEAIYSAGYIPGLWGHVDAESFQNLIALQIGAYDNSVWPLIEKSLSTPPKLSAKALSNTLKQCESELGRSLIYDKPKMLRSLKELSKEPFRNLDDLAKMQIIPSSTEIPTLIYPASNQKSYFQRGIDFLFQPSSEKEIAAFLRLAPIFCDTATYCLSKHGIRTHSANGPELTKDGKLCCYVDFYTDLATPRALLRTLKEYSRGVIFRDHKNAIQKYIKPFKNSSEVAAFFPVDYFQCCDVLISRPLIAKSFTPTVLQKIWNNTQISGYQEPTD